MPNLEAITYSRDATVADIHAYFLTTLSLDPSKTITPPPSD
jgi:hypothetical protein